MTVGAAGSLKGKLLSVVSEAYISGDDAANIVFATDNGIIHSDLTIGANTGAVHSLVANKFISSRGHELGGAGFIVTLGEASALALGSTVGLDQYIRSYLNGRDLTARPRGVRIIDLFGLTSDEVRRRYPAVYQWLFERVRPERDQNRMSSVRERWWLHRRLREDLRKSLLGLSRFIATVETAKHRTFQFVDTDILPDNMIVAIALEDSFSLGVLSSRVHAKWALGNGGSLRVFVGNVRYKETRCFETFPFPSSDTGCTPQLREKIADLGAQIDAHRKRRQGIHSSLTVTGMYNVLEKMRAGEPYDVKEKFIYEQDLVSVLKTLHDELDAAVLEAYGWSDLADPLNNRDQPPTANLLKRLVALNVARSVEEAAGIVRLLRPDFQNSISQVNLLPEQEQSSMSLEDGYTAESSIAASNASAIIWPRNLPEQVRAIATALKAEPRGLSLTGLTIWVKGRGQWKKDLMQILETFAALGRARNNGGTWHLS